MFSGSSLPDWVLEATDCKLFEAGFEAKQVIIKKAVFASNEAQALEVLVAEISDGQYYLPALIDPGDVRKEIGLENMDHLNCQELKDKVLDVKSYLIAAYRIDEIFYPYVIILEFNFNEKMPAQSIGATVDVCQHEQVKAWINQLTSSLPDPNQCASSFFRPKDISESYLDIQSYEPIIEMILSIQYKDRIIEFPTASTAQQVPPIDASDSLVTADDESRKRMISETSVQAMSKRARASQPIAEGSTLSSQHQQHNDSNDLVERYQSSVQAQFDAMTCIPDIECIIPSSIPALKTNPSMTESTASPKTPSLSMDLGVLSMNKTRSASPLPPPRELQVPPPPIEPQTPPPQMNLETLDHYEIVSQSAKLKVALTLKAPPKSATACQRRKSFIKMRQGKFLESLHV